MKLVCSKANLLNGVQTVSKAVPSKTTMSILECILVDATNGEIKLTANDMELGIETTIEGQIVEKGIIALDAKMFLEIVRKLPDSDITIETDASFKVVITCEKAKFTIIGKSGEDFSYLPAVEKDDSIVTLATILAAPIEMLLASPLMIGTCRISTPGIVTASFNNRSGAGSSLPTASRMAS